MPNTIQIMISLCDQFVTQTEKDFSQRENDEATDLTRRLCDAIKTSAGEKVAPGILCVALSTMMSEFLQIIMDRHNARPVVQKGSSMPS